jgi:predicted DNA-binding transcriptional regulator YafY
MSEPREKPLYHDIQRSLVLLRQLQHAPATKATLMEYVLIEVGTDAYADDAKRAGKQFERDIDRLRTWGVNIVTDHRHEYRLVSYGEFSPVSLRDEELGTVAFLLETFAPGAPQAEAVQQLLQRVLDWIPVGQRDAIGLNRQRLRVDLRRRDDDFVPDTVQTAVEKAYNERRRLRFWYLSPGQADGAPRRHTVEPWFLHFDTMRRHLYLDAYRLHVSGPLGEWPQPRWQKYRLGRIQPDDIEVLPDKLPPTPPKRPRHELEYLLAPEIARLGQVSRHFDDMTVHPPDEDGWVRVTAKTDDLFAAIQTLLGYGARCRVIGGAEARQAMEENVAALAKLYKLPVQTG